MLGDNHYANSTEPEKLRVYYTAHRLTGAWRELAAHSPVYAIWDDHDYGVNDSDSTQKGKEESLRIFKEYWANPSCGEAENPGCYYTFTRGDVQFFMLDCRYYRSPNKAPDGPEKTMLGAKQLEWLKRGLSESKARIKILATGSEWETFSSEDSWKSFRTERDAFFAWIDEQKIEGIILISGDRHFAAAYHVVGRFVELSGGPFGSGNATLKPNPERFTAWDEGRLWFILDLDTTKPEPAVAVELWQAGGGRLDRRVLTWDQVNGRAKIAPSPFPLKPGRMEVKDSKPT
jgi:alkaline phosphatase D